MSLPSEVRKHQTVWVDVPGRRTAAVRYEMDGDRIVCFGDDGLSSLAAGTKVTASLGGLADGPLDVIFWAYVKEVNPNDVSLALLSDLVGDRALGRTSGEVVRNLEAMRSSRRLVTLEG